MKKSVQISIYFGNRSEDDCDGVGNMLDKNIFNLQVQWHEFTLS